MGRKGCSGAFWRDVSAALAQIDWLVMSLLIAHLESRLGKIQSGWTRDPEGADLPFRVAEFRGGGQLVGSTSYATVGLSRHYLPSPSGGREMSMELTILSILRTVESPLFGWCRSVI